MRMRNIIKTSSLFILAILSHTMQCMQLDLEGIMNMKDIPTLESILQLHGITSKEPQDHNNGFTAILYLELETTNNTHFEISKGYYGSPIGEPPFINNSTPDLKFLYPDGSLHSEEKNNHYAHSIKLATALNETHGILSAQRGVITRFDEYNQHAWNRKQHKNRFREVLSDITAENDIQNFYRILFKESLRAIKIRTLNAEEKHNFICDEAATSILQTGKSIDSLNPGIRKTLHTKISTALHDLKENQIENIVRNMQFEPLLDITDENELNRVLFTWCIKDHLRKIQSLYLAHHYSIFLEKRATRGIDTQCVHMVSE